jgi:hypothetical protein
VPLSHPKDKHKRMANNAELQKIVVEDKLIVSPIDLVFYGTFIIFLGIV